MQAHIFQNDSSMYNVCFAVSSCYMIAQMKTCYTVDCKVTAWTLKKWSIYFLPEINWFVVD